jgi:hypothetical protein
VIFAYFTQLAYHYKVYNVYIFTPSISGVQRIQLLNPRHKLLLLYTHWVVQSLATITQPATIVGQDQPVSGDQRNSPVLRQQLGTPSEEGSLRRMPTKRVLIIEDQATVAMDLESTV